MISKDLDKLPGIRANRTAKVMKACLAVLNKYRLTEKEMLYFLSNFVYSAGAAIAGHKDPAPGANALNQKYYEGTASVGEMVMLEALNMSTWVEDIDKKEKEDEKEPLRTDSRT